MASVARRPRKAKAAATLSPANKLSPIPCRIEARYEGGRFPGWALYLAVIDPFDRSANPGLDGTFLGFGDMEYARRNATILSDNRWEPIGQRPLSIERGD